MGLRFDVDLPPGDPQRRDAHLHISNPAARGATALHLPRRRLDRVPDQRWQGGAISMTARPDVLQVTARRWSTLRIGVLLVAGCWLLLASSLPASLHSTGLVIVLALLALDLALGVTTDWL